MTSFGAAATLPLDLEAALEDRGWRNHFAWPVETTTARSLDDRPAGTFFDVIAGAGEELRSDIALHVAPVAWMSGLGLLETALLVQEAERRTVRVRGGDPFAYKLRGMGVPADIRYTPPVSHPPNPSLSLGLRRVVRTASWTTPSKLLATLVRPDAVAVSHNGLLVDCASRANGRVAFRHSESMIASLPDIEPSAQLRTWLAECLDAMASLFADKGPLEPPFCERLRKTYSEAMAPVMENSAKLMLGLRALRRFPKGVWAGTGGYAPVRAIRIEARHRGVPVVGHDHGGSTGMADEPFANALLELSVADRYVMPSTALAAAVNPRAQALVEPFGSCEIVGGNGDSSFLQLARSPKMRRRGPVPPRRRVLYVTGPYIGPRQRAQPRMHDVVKLDWQLRLIAALQELPIDLMCQPHPGGVMRGQDHPLAAVANVSGRRFEEVIDWADTIVTDMVLSTTLWKAVCCDIPIVVIDLGMCEFNTQIKPALDRRVRFVTVEFDESNRPIVDADALAARIFETGRDESPIEMQRLLGGSDRG